MAELVDALDSKSSFRKEVGVRFPLPAPPVTALMRQRLSAATATSSCDRIAEPLQNYSCNPGEESRSHHYRRHAIHVAEENAQRTFWIKHSSGSAVDPECNHACKERISSWSNVQRKIASRH